MIYMKLQDEHEIMDILKCKYVVLDTEDDTKGNPYLFGVYTADGFYHFTKADECLAFLLTIPVKYIFCYNLTYDIFNLMKWQFLKYDYFFIGSRVAKLVIGKKVFLDVYNHWNISIERAGKIVGLEKIKVTDYRKRVSVKYLKRDCEIGYLFIEKMLKVYKQYDIDYRLTIASSSLNYFIKKYEINCEISDYSPALRKAYYGARTEIFRKGDCGKCYKYDINSAYPYVMAGHPYPYPLNVVKSANLDYDGISIVRVKSDMSIPVLPYRNDKGEIFFPNGTFTGTYTNNELRYFTSAGGKILKVLDGLHFKKSQYIFKDFCETFYMARLQAKNEFERFTLKIFLNSLYGKFAERKFEQRVLEASKLNLSKYDGRIFGDKIIINEMSGMKSHANVIWSAMVTAYVRTYLHSVLAMLGNDNIIYCDTDSIISKVPMPDEMIDAVKLGAWKKEGYGKCIVYSPKHYTFAGETKTKGVPQKHEIVNGKYCYDKPYKILEAVRQGKTPNVWERHEKVLTDNIKNKIVSGKMVKPITIKR